MNQEKITDMTYKHNDSGKDNCDMNQEKTTATYEDGAERGELVVEQSRLVDAACLERHLQTAQPHPKAHAVHVDVARQSRGRRFEPRRQMREIFNERIFCVFVFKN